MSIEQKLREFKAEIHIHGNEFHWNFSNQEELVELVRDFLKEIDSEFNDECKFVLDEMERGCFKEDVNVVPYACYERLRDLLVRKFPSLKEKGELEENRQQ